jgi:hypothetical protein
MRKVWLVGVLGMALPAVAGAQGLGPRTITNWQVQCADLPASEPPGAPLWVAASERGDGRLAIAPGELIVIQAGTEQGLKLGQALVSRRVDRGRESYNGVKPGAEGMIFGRSGYYGGVRSTALLTIERIDARFALARVVKACDQIEVGDLLEPAVIPALPAAAAMGPENFDDRAMVMIGRDLREDFGDGDVLAINRGSKDGVTPGTRFSLYRVQQGGSLYNTVGTNLPMSERGEAVVLDVTETTSRAVLVRVRDVVHSGDVAVRRTAGKP